MANEMLSLLGSLQPDPFSPRHTIQHDNTKTQKEDEGSSESEESEVDEGSSSESESDDVDDDESDIDTLQSLGKRKDLDDASKSVGRVKDKKR